MKRNWNKFYRNLCKVLAKEFEWNKGCHVGAYDNYEKCEDCSDYSRRLGIDPPCIDHG